MDLESTRRELERSSAVRQAAASPEAARLARELDAAAVEQALRSGDAGAMRRMMQQILASPEGRALAERLRSAVGDHG